MCSSGKQGYDLYERVREFDSYSSIIESAAAEPQPS